ncbi:PREDICTED: uncharacterized protein LOC109585378 [Amphimedon queenslandica]|uniref:Uncharacterized protein n=1 Tax=Amphimedon queenslandica TaxID=400682 RepID=A0AAN0JJZ3_AMPQE|nr:PREDICTED: uncharacterized protein LOC109585378 [Amphimedon queenslandica]|eukprot:XP_019857003.1 PREDICTED: uncharacterized protein LOC109585378 [Amphimedon queenslandica]
MAIKFLALFKIVIFYLDKPVLSPDDVYAIATCNGIQVEGQKDNDTVIMATVKDSLNHTVHRCNISSLPYLINYTVLPPDIDFNIEFVGVNPAGCKNLATYNVQDVLVSTEGNGSVSVQCVFVSGSTADGCDVVFTDTDQESSCNVSLLLNQEPTLVTLPAGNYTVTAYDNINGSLYGPVIQYPSSIEIQATSTTPPIEASEGTSITVSPTSSSASDITEPPTSTQFQILS